MRALRISLIVLGVVAVLAVVADRVAVFIAQGEVASRARDSLSLTSEPDASVRGFPFLTQVLGGRLNRVDLGMDDYQALVDGETLTVQELDVELRDVELGDGYSSAVAERAVGDGLIAYEELTRAYGELLAIGGTGFTAEFGYAGEERVLVTLQASLFGQGLDVGEVPAEIVVEDGRIQLVVEEEDIPDTGDPALQQTVEEQLNTTREISGLPAGITLDGLEPTEDGLRLTISGTSVDITG